MSVTIPLLLCTIGHLAAKESSFDMPQLSLSCEFVQASGWAAAMPFYPNLTGPPNVCAIAYMMLLFLLF